MLMGADGCIYVAHHEYINTASFPGFFDVDQGTNGDHPVETCADDPFGLDTSWGLEHALAFWIGGWDSVPAFAWGTLPTGPAHAAFPPRPQLGWFWWGSYVPSQIEVRGTSFNGVVYKSIWYTTIGTWHPDPAACAAGQRCAFLEIRPSIGAGGANLDGTYDILSGWTQGATVCTTRWANRQLSCHYGQVIGDQWPYCWLPSTADERFPAPDGTP